MFEFVMLFVTAACKTNWIANSIANSTWYYVLRCCLYIIPLFSFQTVYFSRSLSMLATKNNKMNGGG
ncbi:hypothetical protein EDM55_17045 [Brevibacillus centrosporus]|nr:hypothetical protein EDM55_17045 [Brevibacillus centrosporus]